MIKRFDTDTLREEHCLIIGESSAKDAVVRDMLNRHDGSAGALVVLDYDGRFYESCGGDALLADFSSKGSVVPDLLETLLHSPYGNDPKTFAMMMQKLLCIPKPDRTSNDTFWSTSSAEAFKQYIEYLCVLYKTEKYDAEHCVSTGAADGKKKDFVLLGKFAGIMTDIMSRVVSYNKLSEYDYNPVEKYLESYVQASVREGAKLFEGTLKNTASPQSNTYQCIYMSMLVNGASFFKAMEMFEHDGKNLAGLPVLNMRSFVSGGCGSAPLFFCGTKRADANQALGALALIAAACAAHDSGTNVTVVIPELERWNLQGAFDYVREEHFGGLSTVTSYGDVSRLASAAGSDKLSVLSRMAEKSDSRLWLYTADNVCEDLFISETTQRERRYKLSEMDGYCAYKKRNADLEYFAMPTAAEEKKVRTRAPLEAVVSKAWIDTADNAESKRIQAVVCCGLPPDLYMELKEMGHVKEERWWKRSPYWAAYDVLEDFLLSDPSRLTKKEREMSCKGTGYFEVDGVDEEEDFSGYLRKIDKKQLIERVRTLIKKMKKEARKTA